MVIGEPSLEVDQVSRHLSHKASAYHPLLAPQLRNTSQCRSASPAGDATMLLIASALLVLGIDNHEQDQRTESGDQHVKTSNEKQASIA